MSDGEPDTTPAGVVDSSPAPLSVEENEISPAAQLKTELNVMESSSTAENISIADENLNIISGGVESCDAEVDTSSEKKGEKIVQEVSAQIEDAKVEDVNVQISGEVAVDKETKCTGDEQNAESISEVTEVLEKIVNEVDTINENDPKLLTTAQDENEGGDAVQNNEQLPATANDTPTVAEANENKETGAEQLQNTDALNVSAETPTAPPKDENTDESNATAETQTAPPKDDTVEPKTTTPPKESAPSVGLREVLFTDQGWSQLWTAIPDKQLSFTAPVLRVEAGRFFWSSETYNKR